jgi:hypothetical protein
VSLEKFENPQALAERLADILVKGALYRVLSYDGSNCHAVNRVAVGSPRFGLLPEEIKMYCGHPRCRKEQQWKTGDVTHYFSRQEVQSRTYACRNCGENDIEYLFIWHELEQCGGEFLKVGQFPPLAIELSSELSKALGEENAELYKKALINANYNHGLGAIAYFRRVLENKVNLIIDLIAEALRLEQVEVEAKELEKIKRSHRVEDKIDFASGILPKNLRPGGHNPLDKLYAAASAGLHGESDDDCLIIFNDARFVFEYLFKNLTVSNEEAREYVKKLSNPLTTKTNRKDESRDAVGVQRSR